MNPLLLTGTDGEALTAAALVAAQHFPAKPVICLAADYEREYVAALGNLDDIAFLHRYRHDPNGLIVLGVENVRSREVRSQIIHTAARWLIGACRFYAR